MKVRDLLTAIARNEENIMKLYLLYASIFRNNSVFWEMLAAEEKVHAAMIGEILAEAEPGDIRFDENVFRVNDIKALEEFILRETGDANRTMINLQEALSNALAIERDIVEKELSRILKTEKKGIRLTLEKLEKDTVRHAGLILKEMEKNEQ